MRENMIDNLSALRSQIDEIDIKLTELFESRMRLVEEVALYKQKNNLQTADTNREQEVINKNVKRLSNQDLIEEVKEFYQSLFNISKKYQNKKRGA